MSYRENQRALQIEYFKGKCNKGGFLRDRRDNIISREIAEEIEQYFAAEGIKPWRLKDEPEGRLTTHTLSSQVACLNHLFPIRRDPEIVSRVATTLTGEQFTEILPVEIDSEANRSYIAFEVISKPNLINEKGSTRGTMCTSIDAMIIARRDNGQRVMIPIEWKYTEFYDNFDQDEKSTECNKYKPMPNEASGLTRLRAYTPLIEQSSLLHSDIVGDNTDLPDGSAPSPYRRSIYFLEPFYELMRQTLLIEQFMQHGREQWIGPVDDYLHVVVCPAANHEFLDKQYHYTAEPGLEAAWRACLTDHANRRFRIIDPAVIASILPHADYLLERYSRK